MDTPRASKSRLRCLAVGVVVVAAVLPGCATVRVRRVGTPDLLEAWRASVIWR